MAARTRLTQEETLRLVQRPGTARNYVDPETGVIYGRRSAEEAQRAYGMRQKVAPSHPMTRYKNVIDSIQKNEQQHGVNRSRQDIRADQATKDAVRGLKSKPDLPNGKWSANSRKAQALVLMGRRQPDDTHDVGDTPKIGG